jgi:hypothetical protein
MGRVGWRPYSNPSVSSLLTSLYGVWNGDTSSTTLATGAYSAWNAEGIVTSSQLQTGAYSAWNGEKIGTSLDSNILRVYTGDNLNDTSGNEQNATNVGGVTFTAGKFGNAFTFNGSNNISLPDNSLNSLTGDFTISMWVKVKETGTLQTLLSSIGTDGTNYYGFAINNYGGTYTTFYTGNGSTSVALNESSPNPYNTWYHVVVTRKAGTRTRIYYNGSMTQSNSDTRNAIYYSGTNRVNIGAFGSTSQRVANGTQIDAVTIWNRELNSGEVLSLYNAGTGAEYPYSALTLPSSNDAIGSNDGILTGGCLVSASGKIGRSFYFDGVNDYVALPNNSLNFTGDFSFSLWMNRKSAVNANILSNYYNGATPYGWWLSISTGTIAFKMGNGTSTLLCNMTTTLLGANVWQLITITKNANSVKMYVDGVLKTSATITGNVVYTTTHYPMIGAAKYDTSSPVGYLEAACLIDGVTTWQKELSSEEVAGLYNGGSGNQYPFSAVMVGTPTDSVSTNHGTIVGGVTYTTGIVGNGNAFQFNGSTGYVVLPNNSLNLTSDFSVSLWANFTSVGSINTTLIDSTCFGNNTSPQEGTSGWRLYYFNGYLFFDNVNDNSNVQLSTTAINTANTWYHITVTLTSGSTIIYVNGTPIVSNTTTQRPNYRKTVTPKIGDNRAGNGKFNGKIDALTIWNKKLTADEVTQLYNIGGGIQYPFTTQTIKTPYSVYNGDNLIDPIGAKNATINGGVTYTTGKIGNAYTFDGTTGYLTLPVGSLNLSGSFSFSMWLKFNGTPANFSTIISNVINASYVGFSLYVNSGNLFIQLGNGTSTWPQLSGPSVSEFTNKWGLITFVWEQGVGPKFYLNGVLYNSATNTSTLSYTGITTAPMIGKLTGGGWAMLNGSIDGLTFWNSALRLPEISTLYNDGNGMEYPYSSSIVSKLPSSSDAYGTNNGTLMNGCTFTTGKIGKAFIFDGVNDYVNLGNDSFNFTGNFSISAWINLNTVSGNQCIMSNLSFISPVSNGWFLVMRNNRIMLEFYQNNNTFDRLQASSTFSTSTWYHITVVRVASTSTKLYINGVLNSSNTSTYNPTYSSSIPIPASIGAWKYDATTVAQFTNGKIDALSVWNKELSATEVTELYNSGNGKQYPNF